MILAIEGICMCLDNKNKLQISSLPSLNCKDLFLISFLILALFMRVSIGRKNTIWSSSLKILNCRWTNAPIDEHKCSRTRWTGNFVLVLSFLIFFYFSIQLKVSIVDKMVMAWLRYWLIPGMYIMVKVVSCRFKTDSNGRSWTLWTLLP